MFGIFNINININAGNIWTEENGYSQSKSVSSSEINSVECEVEVSRAYENRRKRQLLPNKSDVVKSKSYPKRLAL